MSSRYSIVEPHPSVPATAHYISTGRGGAGNAIKPPTTITRGSDASGPASRISLSNLTATTSHGSAAFHSGRGGAGNVHPTSERAIFSFDEELERQLSQERHAAPVYHVGRGGAGNVGFNAHKESKGSPRTFLDSSSRRRSEDSTGSTNSMASESGADQFNRGLKKSWKKITGAGNF